MDNETRDKYLSILRKGHTLKADKEDMLEVVTGDEELNTLTDQSGKLLRDNPYFLIPQNKVIAKVASISNTNTEKKDIIYWSPCEFSDILAVIGVAEFDGTKYNSKYIKKEDQVSIYGKDIKKAIENIKENLNPLESLFYDTYINTEHPIADNVFYTLYVKEADGRQIIKCTRNTTLSPRPVKKDEA